MKKGDPAGSPFSLPPLPDAAEWDGVKDKLKHLKR